MVIRVGIIGLSEGNGHPFSFSAIINGYDTNRFADAGWPEILDYLNRQPTKNFGFDDVKVTHAWTQNKEVTDKLCAACLIEKAVKSPEDMLGQVDALIIGRDDWETHAPLAMPFLKNGTSVFIDKPLTLDMDELAAFEPYLRSGILMSTAGLRYARELDLLRKDPHLLGNIHLVSATVLNGVDRYGVHMLDAISSLGLGQVSRALRRDTTHEAYAITLVSGVPVNLDCLGAVGKTFHISVFGDLGQMHVDLYDNFSAFHRTLDHFFHMVRTNEAPIAIDDTIKTMRFLSSARAMAPGDSVEID